MPLSYAAQALDILSNASLAKLTIQVFDNRERTGSFHTIKVPFNPDSVSLSYTNNWGNEGKASDGIPMLTSHNLSSSGFSCKLIFAESDALLRGFNTGYGEFEREFSVLGFTIPLGSANTLSQAVTQFLTI